MKVCIAEKPGVARDIANVIGAKQRKDGYFEGNGYAVTWTYGHLCSLKEPADYDSRWKYWNMNTLPMIPLRFGIRALENEGVAKQLGVIKKLFDDADEIINCGDAGQEGELIQRWVMQYNKVSKPVKRLWISSLTEEAIKEGFEHLRDGKEFDNLYAAGCARAIGDWLLGINATRLYTLKYAAGKSVLSVGRVQTPTLALVVKRQQEIDNFVPSPYWELRTVYREVEFGLKQGRFDKQEDAMNLLAEIESLPFTIVSVKKTNGKEAPPKLFDLTSLQVECNKKYSFTAEHTLEVIQALYEKKLTTYPRVDTTYLPDDIYSKSWEILKGLVPYANFIEPLSANKLLKRKQVFDNKKITDHHAIIPTGKFYNNMQPDEKRVYDLVARRFISVFYPDCQVSNTVVIGKSGSVEFKATGKQILKPGWRVLYKNEKNIATDDSKNAQDQELPEFVDGESGTHAPSVVEKSTQPPKYYTEATLLRAMETAGKTVENEDLREALKENGIGRPSTRAGIIETLFKRNYVVRDKKRIVPTETGKKLIATIDDELLKSAELTGIWEKKMRDIEKGVYDVSVFVSEMKEMVIGLASKVKRGNTAPIV